MEELNAQHQVDKSLSFVVLGNKADLGDGQDCPCDTLIMRWCEKQRQDYGVKILYFRTSAKTGMGIDDAFKSLSRDIIQKSNNAPTQTRAIKLTQQSQRRSDSAHSTDLETPKIAN